LEDVFETLISEILTIMAEGKNLEIRGFGSFKIKTRKKRRGRNPRTGIVVEIPPYKTPTFKISKDGQKAFENKVKEITPEKPTKMVFTAKEPDKEIKELPTESLSIDSIKIAESFSV
jgi:nucleoid DNA-binding protein